MMDGRFLLTCVALISLLALQGGRLAEAQGIAPSEVCGLEGFELDTLAQPKYWSLTIERQHCLIPLGYAQSDITECVVYMSVCKPLPGEQCNGQTNSSTCQEVTTNDGGKHYFSIGDYRGNDGYEPLGDDAQDEGFVTIRQGDTASSLRCNSTFETSITWACAKDAVWDISSPNATAHLRTATNAETDCNLFMTLLYNGACYVAPTLAPDTCELAPYDVPALAAQDYWYATVPPERCYNTGSLTCKIYFAFCQALPISISSVCYGAAVCQVGTNSNGESYAYNMGKFNNTLFYDNADAVDGGFHMDVENGTLPADGNCNQHRGLSTRVVLLCNSTADWNNQNVSKYAVAVHEATDPCSYTLVIPYSGACIPVAPTIDPSICALSPFDVLTLAAQDYWYAIVPPEVCFNTGSTVCRIYFAFCQGLPHSINSACYGAAVCQVGTDSAGGTYAYNMGKFNNLTRYVKNDDLLGVGFHIDVENGTEPTSGQCNHLGGLKTRVILVCDSTVEWINRDVSNYIEVIYLATDPCSYVLRIPYSGACIPVAPLRPSPVGWILIGLFFFAVIVYLVVGTLFQYVVRGARGLEMIPNYEFWAQFFFMVLEGCKFSLDIITCFQCDGKMKPSIVTSAGRGGVEYDKI